MSNTVLGLAGSGSAPRYSYTSLRLVAVEWRGPGLVMARYRVLGKEFPGISPGQFILFWVPGLEAIPLSPIYSDEEELVLLVRERGETTRSIVRKPPEYAGAIGPLGSPIPLRRGRILVVAGGVGAASAIPVAREARARGLEAHVVYGVRRGDELAPVEKYAGAAVVLYATEDGSKGVKGTVIDALNALPIPVEEYGAIYAAGPNPMLCSLYEWMAARNMLDKLFLAPERIVRCGLGFCGRCAIPGTSLLLCRDGVFLEARLLESWVSMGCPTG